MATENKNLSAYNKNELYYDADVKVGIVVSEWNGEITKNLLKGTLEVLHDAGYKEEQIQVEFVPGTFELPLASDWMLATQEFDAVIAIGVVIQGETKHFDFVCQGVTKGIVDVNLKYQKPVIFCVLTDNNIQQSIDRAGGKHGNKGIEAGVTCLKMIALQKKLKK